MGILSNASVYINDIMELSIISWLFVELWLTPAYEMCFPSYSFTIEVAKER